MGKKALLWSVVSAFVLVIVLACSGHREAGEVEFVDEGYAGPRNGKLVCGTQYLDRDDEEFEQTLFALDLASRTQIDIYSGDEYYFDSVAADPSGDVFYACGSEGKYYLDRPPRDYYLYRIEKGDKRKYEISAPLLHVQYESDGEVVCSRDGAYVFMMTHQGYRATTEPTGAEPPEGPLQNRSVLYRYSVADSRAATVEVFEPEVHLVGAAADGLVFFENEGDGFVYFGVMDYDGRVTYRLTPRVAYGTYLAPAGDTFVIAEPADGTDELDDAVDLELFALDGGFYVPLATIEDARPRSLVGAPDGSAAAVLVGWGLSSDRVTAVEFDGARVSEVADIGVRGTPRLYCWAMDVGVPEAGEVAKAE
ncbi:MAG: hypothetical protein JSW52_06640 [Candidatus Coatesbacteria bacterium]|nr:MAG: hypothetical protein JSW52_06640 [Candidatus Coatesbacteria bacterium]